MNMKKIYVPTLAFLLILLFNTAALAAYTESFTITESGGTKADTLNENAIVIRNNRSASDVGVRGPNLREAYIKIDVGAYSGQYPVQKAQLRLYLKQKPSNAGVSSEQETPTCDVYAFGIRNTNWSGTSITYQSAVAEGVRPDIDELSDTLKTYAEDKERGYLDMHSFDSSSSVTEAYYYDITQFVNDLLASGQTSGTICLMQAGGSISRESTVMQFYCEDTAADSAMIPAVEITSDVKLAVKTVKDFSAGKKPTVTIAGYNNIGSKQTYAAIGVITNEDGRLYDVAVTDAELEISNKAQAIKVIFNNPLPADITGYELNVYMVSSINSMKLINRSVKHGDTAFEISSAVGDALSGYPSIKEYGIDSRDAENGTITIKGTLDVERESVEIAARAYVDGEESTSLSQAYKTATTNEDGGFTLMLTMPDASDTYDIIIGGLNIKEKKTIDDVVYFRPTDIGDALEDVNDAVDATALELLLRGENELRQKYAELLGIEYKYALEAINSNESLTTFCEYIVAQRAQSQEGEFASTKLFLDAVNEAADLRMISRATNVTEETKNIIEGYASDTDIYTKIYTDAEIALEDSVKDDVILSLLGKEYADMTALDDEFEKAVVVTAITKMLYGRVEQILSIGKNVLGFDINTVTEYQQLSTEDKAAVMKKFANANIVSDGVLAFLQNAITEVNAAKLVVPNNPNVGFAGGSGGSSVVIKVTPEEREEMRKDIPEPIDITNIGGFKDMNGYEWAMEYVNDLAKNGVVVAAEFYRPGDFVSRAEYVKMLVDAADLEDTEAECDFEDTQKGMWHYMWIASAYKNGIASGVSESIFNVDANITRQEMALMAYRVLKLKNIQISLEAESFSDDMLISDWAVTAVYALKNSGIITGVSATEFAPQSYATRAEAAVIISKLATSINSEGVE